MVFSGGVVGGDELHAHGILASFAGARRRLLSTLGGTTMQIWLFIFVGSSVVGALSALFLAGRTAAWVAGGLPWLAFLLWVLYQEYVVSRSQDGGASMWPIAVLWAGSIAAAVGWGVYRVVSAVARAVGP
jgi:hypothetical protein